MIRVIVRRRSSRDSRQIGPLMRQTRTGVGKDQLGSDNLIGRDDQIY